MVIARRSDIRVKPALGSAGINSYALAIAVTKQRL
jgi:hypothetical protein